MHFVRKLSEPGMWDRILRERFAEPLRLNMLSIGVAAFGSFRRKVDFDLVVRRQNAFSILKAADFAAKQGVNEVCIVEFGVAAGAGIVNMVELAARTTKETGVRFRVAGFDTGAGMPPAKDYRDHPELYQEGDFRMDRERLERRLAGGAELHIGDIAETLPAFLGTLTPAGPIGYVAIDVDYYTSAVEALRVFEGPADCYLPVTLVYLDDIAHEEHNAWAGELLAVREFNERHEFRKIERHAFLETGRIFQRAPWIKHVWYLHVLDHPRRNDTASRRPALELANPYLAGD